MKKLTFLFWLPTLLALAAAPDERPAFDKSPYRGTLWTQVNPWWLPNKPRQNFPLGGPNYARKIYPADPVGYWKEAIRETQRYGMTGWQFELNVPTPGYGHTFLEALQAATELQSDFKFALFLGMYRPAGGVEEAIQQLFTQFDLFAEEWKTHPNIFRLDGRPVISVYTPFDYSVEEWRRIMAEFEAKYGGAVWLLNFWWGTYDVASKPAQLREYLPIFDGVTAYANWADQRELYEVVGKIMHEEFPQKIFEGTVHNTFAVHYYHGGVPIVLSGKYRDSWQSMHDAAVDAVVMTNLFDHWENSLVLPCYEREDFLLRYAEVQMHELFGTPFAAATTPELVLTNYIDLIPGRRPLRFEIIAFPLDATERQIQLTVEVCDSAGTVLHTFPVQETELDRVRTLVFELPPEMGFFNQRAVIPRIVVRRNGTEWRSDFNPPTILDTSIRTSWMFWARSTRNRVAATGDGAAWQLNGQGAGSTVNWHPTNGFGVFNSTVAPLEARAVNQLRIMRNAMEWQSLPAESLELNRAFSLPYPGAALNFYWMEMETPAGNRLQTLPIWVDAGVRPGQVKLPVFLADQTVADYTVEAVRVPFFHYPCAVDTGNLLLDISGYNHHGQLQSNGQVGYAFGSLGATGYYHVHNGGTGGAANPHFRRAADGAGYLHFDGAEHDFYMISGGTAFPYAATWELEFRVGAERAEMYLLGTANNQIQLRLDAAGYLCASRGGVSEGIAGAAPASALTVEVKSRQPVTPDQWHRVAAVYDLRELRLYLDGELQGSAKIAPTGEHETIDHVTLAAGCGFLHNPHTYFTGDLRNIRFYGRNLTPPEFLH